MNRRFIVVNDLSGSLTDEDIKNFIAEIKSARFTPKGTIYFIDYSTGKRVVEGGYHKLPIIGNWLLKMELRKDNG